MKVFNLTDVSTKKLEQHHATSQLYVISGTSISPGDTATFPDADRPIITRETEHLVKIGAIALDKIPEEYLKKKTAQAAPPKVTAPVAAAPSTPPPAQAKPATTPPPAVAASAAPSASTAPPAEEGRTKKKG